MEFIIEDKIFKVKEDNLKSDKFVVKSIPHDYQVCFDYNQKPGQMITSLFKQSGNFLLVIDQNILKLYLYLCIKHSLLFL